MIGGNSGMISDRDVNIKGDEKAGESALASVSEG
jgi:hypothetical protein